MAVTIGIYTLCFFGGLGVLAWWFPPLDWGMITAYTLGYVVLGWWTWKDGR